MAVLFVSNNPLDMGLSAAHADTTTTGRDTAYSPISIACGILVGPSISVPAGSGVWWFHFRLVTPSSFSSFGSKRFFSINDSSNNIICDFWKTGSGTTTPPFAIRSLGSSTVTGANYTMTTSTVYQVDVKLTVGASGGSIVSELYMNGSLVSTATATNSGTVRGQPALWFFDHDFSSSAATLSYFSEFIIATDESTVGARLATLSPNSAGAFSDMSGTIASLTDYDISTGLVSNANGQRSSFVNTAYGGPASPASVRGVFLRSRGLQAGGAPTRVRHFLRISSTNYDGASQLVLSGQANQTEWAQNPATAANWTTAALAALETGLLSAA